MSKPAPHFTHDCEACVYLGHVIDCGPAADLYFCTQRGCGCTVIARFTSVGHDYTSGLVEGLDVPILQIAAVRAVRYLHAALTTRRRVQLYQDLRGDDHTAKFLDEPGKWEASKISSTGALGRLVISHPEDFNVEIVQTHEWVNR